jgi:PhzF family phenazine biosynthesis protein
MVTMEQSAPEFGAQLTEPAELAAALGLTAAGLLAGPWPQVVSTGAGHLLVPVRDPAAVDRAVPDQSRLAAVLRAVPGAEGCYLYSPPPEGLAAAAYTRFFNPIVGIAEDPATGTAAGPLAARLVAGGQAEPGRPVIIEQGHALGRPSRIEVTVSGTQVRLSGSGLVVAEGTLRV